MRQSKNRRRHKKPRVVTCLRCRRRIKRRKIASHQRTLRCKNEGIMIRNTERMAESDCPIRTSVGSYFAKIGVGVPALTAIDARDWSLLSQQWIPVWADDISRIAFFRDPELALVLQAAWVSPELSAALVPLIALDDWEAIVQLVRDAEGLDDGEGLQQAEAE